MELFSNEQEIETLNKEGITLTTHRIRSTRRLNDHTHVTSIMLESLCSCECFYSSNYILLGLGVLVFIGSLVTGIQISAWGYTGIILAIIFIGSYFLGRGGIMIFSSSGAKIETIKTNIGLERMEAFIDKVESAKNERYCGNNTPSSIEQIAGY